MMKFSMLDWMHIGALGVSIFCTACVSVSEGEQNETLKRVLELEEATQVEESSTSTAEVTDADKSTTQSLEPPLAAGAPQPPPNTDLSTESRASIPPNLQQPTGMDLPLPRGVAHADLLHFVNLHEDVTNPYQPLAEEWKLYAGFFGAGRSVSADDISGLRVRIRENLARAHWLFVWGAFQASLVLLSQRQSVPLMIDRQQDFVDRMNVLVFLMTEMQNTGMKSNHRTFLREFYKHTNAKYFRRALRDRPQKQIGPLKPEP